MTLDKTLTKKWYEILKQSGFNDIETPPWKLKEPTLNHWDTFICNYIDPTQIEARQEYYLRAYQFLMNHSFDSDYEKQIWQLYSQGLGERPISNTINESLPTRVFNKKKSKVKSANRYNVRKVLAKLKLQFHNYLATENSYD